jgi:hypothetical protein
MCCKLLDIPALEKPANQWCRHCAPGRGCTIYDQRPAPCRDFVCVWLESQGEANPLPMELRPDKCKVVLAFAPDRRDVMGYCDPAEPDAWSARPVLRLLEIMSCKGLRVIVGNGRHYYALDRGRARRAELTPPDQSGTRQFVRFLDP